MAYAGFHNNSTRSNLEERARKMETHQAHDSINTTTSRLGASEVDNTVGEPSQETISAQSAAPAVSDSPSSMPLHLPAQEHDSSGTSTGGGAAVGTPSTVSTAPSTEDDASTGGTSKSGLDKIPLLWGDTTPREAGLWPRPRDPGIQETGTLHSVPTLLNQSSPDGFVPDSQFPPLLSSNASDAQQQSHRRSKSWGAGSSRPPVGPSRDWTTPVAFERPSSVDPPPPGELAMPNFSLPGTNPFLEPRGGLQTHLFHSSPSASPPHSLPHTPPRAPGEHHPWAASAQTGASRSRVASFRNEPGMLEAPPVQQSRYVYAQVQPDVWPREGQRQQFVRHPPNTASGYHTPPYASYNMGKPGYAHSPPAATTPPRAHNPRQGGPNPHRQMPHSGGSSPVVATPPRSSAEILKTLLRKKACLYEPETSRAVALVTWMVGRELALEYGYFSRQQLQSGVHACVAKKIESGAITRTKVNRCMQIILNSCFHYIIPRPDGTEESALAFRDAFVVTAVDDSHLVRTLEPPWDNLLVDRGAILEAAGGDGGGDRGLASPDVSPRLESVRRGGKSGDGAGDGTSKRTVLLCFNENVRCMDDVFRCHTEFIRDTANASKLQLSAKEWRAFFGKDSHISGFASVAKTMGVPAALTQTYDSLGQMIPSELAVFRTTWCAKRYDHDHELCGFAHVEVNGGWLRRNPMKYAYKPEMCPLVSTVMDDRWGPRCFVINSCPKGEDCPFAHSKEEIDYHPERYKSHTCSRLFSRGTPVLGRCPLGDICPHLHPSDANQSVRMPESGGRKPQAHRKHQARTPTGMVPQGAPMLYVDPAPMSKFEERLAMPGLQSLFRRHCHVINAYLRAGPDQCNCFYSNFDDFGIAKTM